MSFLFFILDFRKEIKIHKEISELSNFLDSNDVDILPDNSIYEKDYKALVIALIENQKNLKSDYDLKSSEMIDYYTTWVHQIKTPISSMRLALNDSEIKDSKILKEDLMCIENYVDMVLAYLRLDSKYSDYLFSEYKIDNIIKNSVKKFSSQFIRKKISLSYEESEEIVLTDEKWISFVIEQIISNALKYTPDGGKITISFDQNILMIQDTGIGINMSDLPRIFEKGYTGYNGRYDKKASGIGLYLCKRICDNLNHKITISSKDECGTTVKIYFRENKIIKD